MPNCWRTFLCLTVRYLPSIRKSFVGCNCKCSISNVYCQSEEFFLVKSSSSSLILCLSLLHIPYPVCLETSMSKHIDILLSFYASQTAKWCVNKMLSPNGTFVLNINQRWQQAFFSAFTNQYFYTTYYSTTY